MKSLCEFISRAFSYLFLLCFSYTNTNTFSGITKLYLEKRNSCDVKQRPNKGGILHKHPHIRSLNKIVVKNNKNNEGGM